jgi:hypothetical protein
VELLVRHVLRREFLPQIGINSHDCVCRFASEQLVIRQLTTVAYRLDPIRIVSLTY